MTASKIWTSLPLIAATVVGLGSAGELAAGWRKATAWTPVEARVTASGIGMTEFTYRPSSTSSRRTATAFIPEYRLEYRYGSEIHSRQLQIGERNADPAAVLSELASHPVGSTRRLFVNPGKPSEVAVNAGFNKETFEPALGGLACAAVFLAVYAGFRLM